GCRVQGSGCRVQGPGCRFQSPGCRVQGPGCRVQGPGCRFQSPGCRVQGPGCRVCTMVHDPPLIPNPETRCLRWTWSLGCGRRSLGSRKMTRGGATGFPTQPTPRATATHNPSTPVGHAGLHNIQEVTWMPWMPNISPWGQLCIDCLVASKS
ncbi:hypothetical protein T484DRAFT_1616158, partial [Baffinella frigidus]